MFGEKQFHKKNSEKKTPSPCTDCNSTAVLPDSWAKK